MDPNLALTKCSCTLWQLSATFPRHREVFLFACCSLTFWWLARVVEEEKHNRGSVTGNPEVHSHFPVKIVFLIYWIVFLIPYTTTFVMLGINNTMKDWHPHLRISSLLAPHFCPAFQPSVHGRSEQLYTLLPSNVVGRHSSYRANPRL